MVRSEKVRRETAEAIKQSEDRHAILNAKIHSHALKHFRVEHVDAAVQELASELRKPNAPLIDDEDFDAFCDRYFEHVASKQPDEVRRPKEQIPEHRTGHRWSR